MIAKQVNKSMFISANFVQYSKSKNNTFPLKMLLVNSIQNNYVYAHLNEKELLTAIS